MDESSVETSSGTDCDHAQPLGDLAGHAKEVIAAVRMYGSIILDEAVAKIRQSIMRAALLVFALVLALIVSALGAWVLISGSVEGVALMVGSQWVARIIIGIGCLACSTAMIIGPLWAYRRNRMSLLRRKYPDQTK
jgi:hypothetical protein